MITLDLKLFGFPKLFINQKPVDLSLKKGIALLIYIAELKYPITREEAATLLWPDADDTTSKARLRRTLHKLRSLTDTEVINATRTHLQLADITVTSDVLAFEQAFQEGNYDQAVDLYQTDFLDSFQIDDSDEFEEWRFFRRESLKTKLLQSLERLYHQKIAQQNFQLAAVRAQQLIELNPLSETAHGYLISAHMKSGNSTAAQHQFDTCQKIFAQELGIHPSKQLESLMTPNDAYLDDLILEELEEKIPETRFTESDGAHLAFQVIGEGPVDIILVSGFVYVSHVERIWEEPRCKTFLNHLSKFGRLIIFDRRGVGLSERVGVKLCTSTVSADINAVMNATGSKKAILVGLSEGALGCIHFASHFPDKISGMVLYGAQAKGSWSETYPFAPKEQQYDEWLTQIIDHWGSHTQIDTLAPSLVGDRKTESWWAGLLRASSSPAAIKCVLESYRNSDVRQLLPQIQCKTLVLHRQGDRAVQLAAGQNIAQTIPNANFFSLDGSDHWFFAGQQQQIINKIESFIHTLAV